MGDVLDPVFSVVTNQREVVMKYRIKELKLDNDVTVEYVECVKQEGRVSVCQLIHLRGFTEAQIQSIRATGTI